MDGVGKVCLLFGCGIKDNICGFIALKKLWYRKKDASQVFTILCQCFVNCALFLCAYYLFYGCILDYIKKCLKLLFREQDVNETWDCLYNVLLIMFTVFFSFPQLAISRVLNYTWCQEIADLTYEHTRGKKYNPMSTSYSLSDLCESIVIQFLFYIQSSLVTYIPIPGIGCVIGTAHLCMLYSLYTFEYKWVQMGWPLQKRLAYVDCKWPYFLGFGLPLAVISSILESYIERISIFSILFPFCVISGTFTFESETQKYNRPLHMFGVVRRVSNFIFCKLLNFIFCTSLNFFKRK